MDWISPGTFVPEFASSGRRPEGRTRSASRSSTQFGWHIVQLLGRRSSTPPRTILRKRAYRQLRESKADEETELWLRRLRDEAYIDTNP